MERKPILTTIVIGLLILLCCCVVIGGTYTYLNRDNLLTYIPMLPTADGGQQSPEKILVDALLTPQIVDTPQPGETSVATQVPGSPTPTQQVVDKMAEAAPLTEDFQAWLQRANVIEGRNVEPLSSGQKLYGFGEYEDTRTAPLIFPYNLVLGDREIILVDEKFRSTVAVNIDENMYLPAFMQSATVIPDLLAPMEQVVVRDPRTGVESVVQMRTGTVLIPFLSTCYSGFGILPWEQRFETEKDSHFETIFEAAYWMSSSSINDDIMNWALPRIRFASVIAAYNAILPDDGATRSTKVLDEIHRQSVELLTKSSGPGAVPSAYDKLLAYFNSNAHQYNFARITRIDFGVIQRGDVYCATPDKIWDESIEATLSGEVPANFLLDPATLRP